MEELVFKQNDALTNVPDISLVPVLADEDVSLASYTKYPLSKLNSLGVAFEPLTSAIHNVFGVSGGTTQLCQVTVPAGTHLASFKSGVGNLGTVLNANNQIAGQAVINPLVCNPTMLFMAAALASIDKKANEKGILEFAKKYDLPFNTYSAEELNSLEGDFTKSEFVKSVVQVDNVCERSAIIESKGRLIRRKDTGEGEGVTVALAITGPVLNWDQ